MNAHRHILDSAGALHAPDHEIGGKARGLARLGAHGAPVPPWYVVTSSAFLDHLAGAPGWARAQRALLEAARALIGKAKI